VETRDEGAIARVSDHRRIRSERIGAVVPVASTRASPWLLVLLARLTLFLSFGGHVSFGKYFMVPPGTRRP
jgi:hypothetical protein